jgi:putative chitinase
MILKLGSKGLAVDKLQLFLGIPQTGNFDQSVDKALRAWQRSNGLKDDGIAGPNTLKKMGILLEEDLKKDSHTTLFNLDKLKGHVPDSVISQIPDTAKKFGITNVLRLSHFLSQCAHESGSFKSVTENLNYSSEGLKKTFSKYFPGNLNESYAKKPEMIASRVYGGRMGNGDESTKDGWKYRGRGYIQLTGKSNYEAFDKIVEDDIVNNPDLVATKYPLMSAAFFFDKNKLWSICDKGADNATVTSVTKRVNGGTIGLEDRIKKFKKYYELLK